MKLSTLAACAAFAAATVALVSNAHAGKNCKFLSTAAACQACKLEQPGVRFSPAQVYEWCAKEVAMRRGQPSPAGYKQRRN
jgi:uncharacterized protein (UPF0179 family)